ncbi:hypothetical protein [Winogradskyella undariae]|uniref:hypothetical protein n=1 Tax=Winogradskyella undariae TaxID=1285465 RepID=UPI0015C900A0|nr:hypothetical protein [Winogradskyella undariae]
MKKNVILYILLIFLIVVNVFFLFTYIGSQNDRLPREPQGNKDFIVKELGFNAEQIAKFKANNVGHHEKIMKLSDDVKGLKDLLFDKLSDVYVQESSIDSITSLISEKEKEKAKEVFYHFKMIQELSTDKQKEKFKTIIIDALRQGEQGQQRPPIREGEEHRPPPPNRQ